MAETLKERTAKGLLWGGVSNGVVQLVGALFGIVLLRLLTPDDYGKIAVLLIFSGIASNLQESGFVAALCNRKDARDEDFNAVFWFNIIVSMVLYVALWFASPLIADFYHEPVLTNLARYLFLGFLISAFGTVQRAYLFRNMMVKQTSIINITALILSNSIGVLMAWQGFAFWGLATQSVSYVVFVQMGNWYISPWRPTLNINLRPAWEMFGFSSKLLVTNLFGQLNSHVFSVLLGKNYSDAVVGHYSNARKWNDMASFTINGMVTSVAQPVLAEVAKEKGKGALGRYRNVFRKMLRFTCFVSFPCMLGLGLIAPEFILLMAGEKWAESAPLLSMLSIYGAFYPVSLLYSNMTISRGRSGINMFCTIVLCIIIWGGLIGMSSMGLYHMVTFFVAVNILWLAVWQWFAWKMVRLSYWSVLKDILPFFLLASGVMLATWFVTQDITGNILRMIAKIGIAVVLYCGLTFVSGARIMRESIGYVMKRRR